MSYGRGPLVTRGVVDSFFKKTLADMVDEANSQEVFRSDGTLNVQRTAEMRLSYITRRHLDRKRGFKVVWRGGLPVIVKASP